MSYLIDTNVLSELVRPKPDKHVIEWFDNVPNEALFISVLTIGEIYKGIEKLPDGNRQEKLRVWLKYELPAWFGNRVLAIDAATAYRWGHLMVKAKRTLATIDSLLAAQALHHELSMVTRNDKDFSFPDLEVINPWKK